MWKRESRIAAIRGLVIEYRITAIRGLVIEYKDFHYFPTIILQHLSIVLAYLGVVFIKMFNLKKLFGLFT